jgi:2-dehydropantoate 2-reductase
MEKSDLKFLVIGAGAVGGITAALMKRRGLDVEIVCKYDDYATLISEEGLAVSGVCGDFRIKIPAYSSLSGVRDKKDIILLATKATDLEEVLRSAEPVLKERGFIISMQNGICEDKIAEITGKSRLIGCVTGWGATLKTRGELEMTSAGDFIIGYPGKKSDAYLSDVAAALSSVVPVKLTDNIYGHKYSKLIINSCITSLGAICGLYLGKMLMIRKVRNIFIEIIRESVAVALKMNINIEIFGGRLDFKKFIEGEGLVSDLRRHMVLLLIGYKYRKLKSSSLQSLERGKPTEIDFLNGYIAGQGILCGVETPVNSYIVNIIHQIEQGKREITVTNFDDPFFNRFAL